MKNGKKPTRRQKSAIEWAGLSPEKWLVAKSVGGMLHLIHRFTNKERIIPMGE
ncbi:hypothetical protein WJ0W_003320 [Paenibacillus melissococcoides]|uniref:DUF6906 domain-containing protein n=1 Tax=Paenibacillus melissococcoides TaxID=2912268 RepID=A0ABM9G338_9BACL|nr:MULTISPECIES: hypothetical protein [Paenibacillus]MEB9893243.1 hypothetical protein [Bacillus cereus]CAH8246083.1 hypothetical protein WJ0W_003320 [Paenibacillus melissococcoides]CAH8712925.1 hypothetical protein WDD9_003399 [Paenibacillus melissococcoides]CAH8713675.1 hypothetical protein HTL2_003702 [Paenibacillus melissococcoides]GIO78718.1 hypothetical protein J6TS7_23280 [Paenibacillus dendritiformis]